MNVFAKILSLLSGYVFLALSALVTFETLLRKLFNMSIQGADELGGYALAVGSSLAFAVALIGRSHIRIDVIHRFLPRMAQAVLNWLSVVLIAAFTLLLGWVCWKVVNDTLDYGSTAATPWATPLIYPQSVWYGALLLFAVTAIILAIRASWLLFSGRIERLNEEFHPKGATEELKDELDDLSRR